MSKRVNIILPDATLRILVRKLGKADDAVMRKIDAAISISLGLIKF